MSRFALLLALVLAFITSLAQAAADEQTIDIFAWPSKSAKSQNLAKISYTSTNATVKSYDAPEIPADDDVVRIGFYQPSGSWSGIATAASNLVPHKNKRLQLLINTNNELYHVGFKASGMASSSKTGQAKDGLDVEIIKMQPGPAPLLNKPVVLNEHGKVDEKEPEKTFLQK